MQHVRLHINDKASVLYLTNKHELEMITEEEFKTLSALWCLGGALCLAGVTSTQSKVTNVAN